MTSPTIRVVTNLFIIKDDSLLLIKAENPNETFYMLVGGKVEQGESCTQAAIREAYEEVGISIKETDLVFTHIISRKLDAHTSSVVLFFYVTLWEGEPFNKEPAKHEQVAWHKLDALPASLRPHQLQALELWKKDVYYSEYGLE